MTDRLSPVGVIDSGVGGLTVAKQLKKGLPNEDILYFGDSKNMPYGNRSKEEIVSLAGFMIDYLEKKGVKAILLACNTISTFIDDLDSGVKLISIVDAGISAASSVCREGETVGVIATKATVDSCSYEKANERAGGKLKLITSASTSLPRIIDRELENTSLLVEKIEECIQPILDKDPSITKLILGCSHFPIIKEEINAVYPFLNLIDPAQCQVEMLRDYLRAENLLNLDNNGSDIVLYTSGEESEFDLTLEKLRMSPLNITRV